MSVSFKKLCEPAKLYLVVSVIFLILAIFRRISALTLITKGFFVLIWTLLLNWLCSKGFKGLAWIIVLLPFIFILMTMCTTMDMMGIKYDGFQDESPTPEPPPPPPAETPAPETPPPETPAPETPAPTEAPAPTPAPPRPGSRLQQGKERQKRAAEAYVKAVNSGSAPMPTAEPDWNR